jgi:DNA polymerase-3 subunit delta'
MHDLLVEIEGQEKALNILSKIYATQRIPNALLFTGPNGIGKHYAAIQFLKMLNSHDNNTNTPQKINSLLEPYVKMIFALPRGKSETNSDSPTAKLKPDHLEEIHEQLKIKVSNLLSIFMIFDFI